MVESVQLYAVPCTTPTIKEAATLETMLHVQCASAILVQVQVAHVPGGVKKTPLGVFHHRQGEMAEMAKGKCGDD